MKVYPIDQVPAAQPAPPPGSVEARLLAVEQRIQALESEQRTADQLDRDALLMVVAGRERRLGLRPKKERQNGR